jgi:hypothetical protein
MDIAVEPWRPVRAGVAAGAAAILAAQMSALSTPSAMVTPCVRWVSYVG